jgi:hypothetical protein
VIGTVLGWGDLETIAPAEGLAFVFGYAFATVLLFRGRMARRAEVSEPHPALVKLQHKALAARRLAEPATARAHG